MDFSERVFECFDAPFASFDVAISNDVPILTEFQFVSFGQRALEGSNRYFCRNSGKWESIQQCPDLEQTFVYAVDMYLQRKEV